MTEKPNYAPGCYGSAIFYNEETVCGSCAFQAQCKPLHLEAQRQLREFLNVTVKPKRDPNALPVKVQKLFDSLNVTKEEVCDQMMTGENPFELRAGFMGVVCHVILQSRAVNRPVIEKVLQKARGLSDETAYQYVRSALQILRHCGAITLDGNRVFLCTPDSK